MSKPIRTYKAFNKDLTCRGFQYEIGETYKVDGEIKACEHGFHGCKNPFDVWGYYDITDSRFAQCLQSGSVKADSSDSKVASAKIAIEAEIALPDFINDCVSWLIKATKSKASSGDYAKQASSGDYAKHEITGKNGVIVSSGPRAKAKGADGTWISLAEFVDGKCRGFATGCIGTKGLEPGVFYHAKGGKLVAA